MLKIFRAATKEPKSLPYIKELPDWFNLQNYKDTNKLDLEGWVTQLYFRQIVEGYLLPIVFTGVIDDAAIPQCEHDKNPLSVQPISQRDAVLIAEAVKSSLAIPNEVWQTPSLFDFLKNANREGEATQVSGLFAWLEDQQQKKQIDPGASLASESSIQVLDKFVSVNLNAPDSVLVAAFKKWLKAHRDLTPKYQGRNFSKATLHRWMSSQVLPYIDLCQWAELSAVQIPHWLMAEALFPRSRQGDMVDRVRKTTEKMAKAIMMRSCLHAMAAQLQHENGKMVAVDTIASDPFSWNINNMIRIGG